MDSDQIIFKIPLPFIGKVPIYWYGFMLMWGFIVGIYVACKRAEKEQIPSNIIIDIGIYSILAGVFGARIFYIIQHFGTYWNDKPLSHIFRIWEGGLVFYGGFIGAIFAAVMYLKKKQTGIPLLKILDVVAPSAALGLAFTRIGCFMNGCCYGRQADNLPWAVVFPPNAPVYEHASKPFPVHPVQIYASIAATLLFIILILFHKHRKRDGEVLLALLILYPAIRFILESFRGDNVAFIFGMTLPQTISVLMFIVALPLFIYGRLTLPYPKVKEDINAQDPTQSGATDT